MKAVMQDAYGSADVLSVREVPVPVPAAGEVLVRVRAAGVNMADWHMMTGLPSFSRLFLGRRAPKVPTRGVDVAGVVEAVGDGVTEFAVGDEVFGSARGSFAEFAVSTPKRLAALPAGVSFEQAAATPMAGYTALQALRTAGLSGPGSGAGRRVLVVGAGGGVGSFAVQLAKRTGAHVTGACSTAKVSLVRELGADEVVDYTKDAVAGEFDVIVETAGGRSLSESRSLLTAKGALVIVGGEGGGRVFGTFGRTLAAPLASMFGKQKLAGLMAAESRDDLVALGGLLASGELRAPVDRAFTLDEAPDAITYLQEGRAVGKVVVVP